MCRSGTIPNDISKCTSLDQLFLNNNAFEGQLPGSVGELSNIQALYLDNNNLAGTIPPELTKLKKLNWFMMFENKVSFPPLPPPSAPCRPPPPRMHALRPPRARARADRKIRREDRGSSAPPSDLLAPCAARHHAPPTHLHQLPSRDRSVHVGSPVSCTSPALLRTRYTALTDTSLTHFTDTARTLRPALCVLRFAFCVCVCVLRFAYPLPLPLPLALRASASASACAGLQLTGVVPPLPFDSWNPPNSLCDISGNDFKCPLPDGAATHCYAACR
jgi:hypothetical protein